jgi:hypothetical protein
MRTVFVAVVLCSREALSLLREACRKRGFASGMPRDTSRSKRQREKEREVKRKTEKILHGRASLYVIFKYYPFSNLVEYERQNI